MIFDEVVSSPADHEPDQVKQETSSIPVECLSRQLQDYATGCRDFEAPVSTASGPVASSKPQNNIPNNFSTYTNLVQSHSGQPMMSTGHEPVKQEQEIQPRVFDVL